MNPDAVRPLLLGPRNAEAVVGHTWRWCRDHARAWGVPVLRVDAKPLIPAEPSLAALEAHAATEMRHEPDEETELEALRRRFGKRRTASPPPSSQISAEPANDHDALPHRLPHDTAPRAR